MAPMTMKPSPMAWHSFTNSRWVAGEVRRGLRVWARDLRFWHRFMNCVPSFKNSLGISAMSCTGVSSRDHLVARAANLELVRHGEALVMGEISTMENVWHGQGRLDLTWGSFGEKRWQRGKIGSCGDALAQKESITEARCSIRLRSRALVSLGYGCNNTRP
jgi:hypothetical protein